MPSLRRVPPGRAGALWLRHRLAVAGRGVDLLQQKLVILLQEGQRLRMLAEVTRREWAEADREGRQWLLRAAALGGDRAVRLATLPDPAEVTLRWTAVIGVRCPGEPVVGLPVLRTDRAPPGTAVALAQSAYRRAAQIAARHAAIAAARAAVDAEAAATRQRVRALERHWVPQLRVALVRVHLQMAELEDADAVRRRRARAPSRRLPIVEVAR